MSTLLSTHDFLKIKVKLYAKADINVFSSCLIFLDSVNYCQISVACENKFLPITCPSLLKISIFLQFYNFGAFFKVFMQI